MQERSIVTHLSLSVSRWSDDLRSTLPCTCLRLLPHQHDPVCHVDGHCGRQCGKSQSAWGLRSDSLHNLGRAGRQPQSRLKERGPRPSRRNITLAEEDLIGPCADFEAMCARHFEKPLTESAFHVSRRAFRPHSPDVRTRKQEKASGKERGDSHPALFPFYRSLLLTTRSLLLTTRSIAWSSRTSAAKSFSATMLGPSEGA